MIWAASRGWAAPVLSAVLLALLVGLPRIRSVGTAAVLLAAAGATGVVWWSGTAAVQAQVVTGVGVLLLGAWRHLGAVATARRGDRVSDPAVLARLTGVPTMLWLASFAGVLAALTWYAALALLMR